MELNNINQLFERIQQIDNKQGISNFTQTNANYPKNPYTQEVYQAYDLYLDSHKKGFSDTRWLTEDEIQANNLRVNPDEKENFLKVIYIKIMNIMKILNFLMLNNWIKPHLINFLQKLSQKNSGRKI